MDHIPSPHNEHIWDTVFWFSKSQKNAAFCNLRFGMCKICIEYQITSLCCKLAFFQWKCSSWIFNFRMDQFENSLLFSSDWIKRRCGCNREKTNQDKIGGGGGGSVVSECEFGLRAIIKSKLAAMDDAMMSLQTAFLTIDFSTEEHFKRKNFLAVCVCVITLVKSEWCE